MTKQEADFIGSMNMCDEISNEAYKKIMCHCDVEDCEDCISRQDTIDAIYKKHIGGKDAVENAPINDLYACGLEEAVDAVENMPPVTPQPKVGEWKYVTHYARRYRVCSECNAEKEDDRATGWNFCPHCGAQMNGGGEE